MHRTLERDVQQDPVADAKAFFERLKPLEDYLLAASARQHRCPLWTGNRKHHPMGDIALFDLPN